MKSVVFVLLNLLTAVWLRPVHCQVLFGPEFTFTNGELIHASSASSDAETPTHVAYLKKWRALATRQCARSKPRCEIHDSFDKHGKTFVVTFEDGFWYQVSSDKNVLEIQTLHSTIETFKARRDLLQKRIFATALELGLSPHQRLGGGHVNMDEATSLQGNFLLYWNFLVDIANHPELTFGIFGGHLGNAPPVAALDEKSISAFKNIFGTSKMTSKEKYTEFFSLEDSYEKRVGRLSNEIIMSVYSSNPYGWDPSYYQALRLAAMIFTTFNTGERRMELRNYRPQRSVDEFILQIEFLQDRINYLRQLPDPIPVRIQKDWNVAFDQKVERFLRMLAEMGVGEDKFSALIPSCEDSLQRVPAVER